MLSPPVQQHGRNNALRHEIGMAAHVPSPSILLPAMTPLERPEYPALCSGQDSHFATGEQESGGHKTLYSMTSSARASNVGGMVKPSALAVLRLMANTKADDCTTGKSAGLAPLRICEA